MARYLVTGGAGFIGSNIAEELVRRGGHVRVLDNFITGKRENIEPFKNKIEFIEGDIRDKKTVKRAVKGIDFISHHAALHSVARSVEDPLETHDVNATGTLNILIAAGESGVKRLVYASTCTVYGDAKKFPQKEEDAAAPIAPYGASKLSGEYYCRLFAETSGPETVILRYFNVFGPRQNPQSRYSSVVPAFISDITKGRRPTIEWDGRQSRDFIFVGDVVGANLLAMRVKNVSGEVFNIGSGCPTTISDILACVENVLNKKIAPKFGPKRAGDIRKAYSDISKAKKILGFRPAVTLGRGLKLTADWFKQ